MQGEVVEVWKGAGGGGRGVEMKVGEDGEGGRRGRRGQEEDGRSNR